MNVKKKEQYVCVNHFNTNNYQTIMRLIHRTNYWGKWIESSNIDDDVDFDAIWTQALADYKRYDCCQGFGRRRVHVFNNDFEREDNGYWSLFLVNACVGYNEQHYFYKFVAIPQGIPHYGKRGCQHRGWQYVGEFDSSNAIDELEELLEQYLDMDDGYINHIHVGLWMDGLYAG